MANSCRVFCGREVLYYMLQLMLCTADTTANATADALLDWSLFLVFFILTIGCVSKELSCQGNQTSPEFSGATMVAVHLGDVYDNATGGGCIVVIF